MIMMMRLLLPQFSRYFPLGLWSVLAVLSPGLAQARPPALVVESVHEANADAGMAEVDLVLTNAAKGPLYLTVAAKSRDGLVQGTSTEADDSVSAGPHQHVTLFIKRPNDAAAVHTDVLWVAAQEVNRPGVFFRTRVDWPHDWPVLAQPKAAQDHSSLLPREDDAGPFYANLNQEDFAAVDLLLQEWNTPAQRNSNGEWKLESFRTAVDQLVRTRRWDDVRAGLGRWRRAEPHSPGAALAEAEAWRRHAWAARGCACAPSAIEDADSMRLFRQRLQHAQRVLNASRHDAAASPLWYEESLLVLANGVHGHRSQHLALALLKAGVARFPNYPPLYLAMARYWAPNGGRRPNWGMVETVADLAAKQTHATDGDDNYAWLYAQLSQHQQIEVGMVRDTALSWPRMRDAFGDLVRRHPSVDNYNLFAVFACRAEDPRSYLNARMKIQGHVERDLWPNNYPVDVCDHRFMQQT